MATTIRAVFDGEGFRVEDAGGLRPGVTYVITVEEALAAGTDEGAPQEAYPLSRLREMATDLGIDDFSVRHDWYAHGRLPDDDPR